MENNQSALPFLFRNRKLLLLAAVTGGILGVGITFFIPKKYMSSATVYPYNSHTKDNLIANPQFGFELETEQLMQLMESKSMRDRTIAQFQLYNYYGIDTNKAGWEAELTLRYIKDITFIRSKYLSVIINAETTSPELSAKIANFQVDEVNNYRTQIFEENRKKELQSAKTQLDKLSRLMVPLRDSIYAVKTDRSKLLYTYIENLDNEQYDAAFFVDDPRLEELVPRYVQLFRKRLGLEEEYNNKLAQYEAPMPSVYVVDRAYPSHKKSSPSTILNGIVGAIAVLFGTITWLVIRRRWKELKSAEQA